MSCVAQPGSSLRTPQMAKCVNHNLNQSPDGLGPFWDVNKPNMLFRPLSIQLACSKQTGMRLAMAFPSFACKPLSRVMQHRSEGSQKTQ